jgi:hypothetical protein
MKILVLGTPFSGTLRIYHMLKLANYDVGHVSVHRDGLVNSVMIIRPQLELKHYLGYDHIYHLVSSPLNTLSQLAALAPHRVGKFTWAEAVWLDTNRYLDIISERRIRVEHMEEDWPATLFKPKGFSRFRLTSKPIRAAVLSDAVRALAIEYGYKI